MNIQFRLGMTMKEATALIHDPIYLDDGGKTISCNVCPAFQRRHTSLFCAAESPNRFPALINTTFENSFIPDGVASTV